MRALIVALLAASTATHAAPRLLALDDVYDCGFTKDGTIVAATAGGLRLGVRVVTALDGLPETHVDALAIDGDVVVATTRAGTARVTLGGAVRDVVRRAIPAVPPASFDVYERGLVRARRSANGRTCIATSDGLYVQAGATVTRVAVSALPTGDVSAIAAAPGGLFVGMFDRGLYRAMGDRLEPIDDPAIHPHINALAYDEPRALLWIATARGLTRCSIGSTLACRRVADRFAKHALLLLDDGRVVAGGDEALVFLSSRGEVEGEATRKSGARFRSVWSIARAPDGTIYAGTTSGIFYGSERAFTHAPETLGRVAMARGALPDDWVTALLVDGDRLLAGTYNAGVVALALDTMERVTASPELGYVNPSGLTRLSDGSIAACTMDGLRVGRVGAWTRVPTLGRDVTAVAAGWIATRRGVSRLERP